MGYSKIYKMKFQRIVFLLIAFAFYFSTDSFTQEYFQQEVNYQIDVSLDDSVHSLSAFEEIEYINNSPDELNYIWFHLWPNGYSNQETALAKQMPGRAKRGWFDNKKARGYIDSLNFKVNDRSVKWEYDDNNICIACRRTKKEIFEWGDYSDEERIIINKRIYEKFNKKN